MAELRLVGLHDDGEHVVLEGADGQRFRLLVDDALRAAVRRDRPQLEQVRAELTGVLPPREIQARIRGGATAAEVAEAAGMPVEMVRRYEGPVLAEREFVAAQAAATRVGREPDAPVLGDLVTDRLATRGVGSEAVHWDAFRAAGGPWTVEVRFEVAGSQRSARWSYDAATRVVRAADDEARWLSETELADEPIPRRHLAAVRGAESGADADVAAALRPVLASVDRGPASPLHGSDDDDARARAELEGAGPTDDPPAPDPTEALLEDLSGRRGVRQAVAPPDEDDDEDDDGEPFEGFGPQHAFDFENPDLTVPVPPAAHPPASRPDQATDARVLPMPAGARRRADAEGASGAGAGEPDDAAQGSTAEGGTGDGGAADDTSRDDTAAADTAAADGAADGDEAPAADETGGDVPAPLARSRARRGRASMPKWDEIVFGAKPD